MAAKKQSTTKSATTDATVPEVPAPSAPVDVAPPATEPVAAETLVQDDQIESKFQSMYAKLVIVSNAVKELTVALKAVQKDYSKTVKSVAKRGRKAAVGKRSPSGFAKPAVLSDELCDFLKIAHKSERARTEVTRMINEYIKANNLQDPNDKRKIIADEQLKKIMNLKPTDALSYFNLQKFIKHHFVRAV